MVSGMRLMIVHQNRHRKPRGGSASRKRSVRGRSQTGRILRHPCRYNLKGTCTRSPCEYWHSPESQFFKTESGCKAGDMCLFPHYKVEEQPSKKPKKNFQNDNNDDKGAVAILQTVSQLGCVSQDSETLELPKSVMYRGNPPGISVCSRIIRLTNNQTKSRKRAIIPTKEEKATTNMLWLL